MNDTIELEVEGHIIIRDITDNNNPIELVNKRNAVHKENMVIAIAGAMANRDGQGGIYSLQFGNGGATIDSTGNIVYSSPNVTGAADVHNPVYLKIIDDTRGATGGSKLGFRHVNGTTYADVEARCVLGVNEPSGQALFDNIAGTDLNTATFVFDEIGLKNKNGDLLTHVTFSPIEKSANRIIEVIYTLRITL